MLINVTTDDILRGVQNDCGNCPVARAILRQVPDIESVQVDELDIKLTLMMGARLRIEPPEPVASFVTAFDDDEEVQPFSFDLIHPSL